MGGLAPGRAHGPCEGLGLAPCRGRAARSGASTLVEEAIRQFGREGYAGASLDDIAGAVGVRKQTLLYYFSSKDALLEACLHAAGIRLAEVIAQALEGKEGYWERAEAVIHAVFGLASEWPEFPMFVREAGRLGPLAFERFADVLDPLRRRAVDFLQSGMDDGQVRKQDPAMLLFTLYTAVVGFAHRGERPQRRGRSRQEPGLAPAEGERGGRVRPRRPRARARPLVSGRSAEEIPERAGEPDPLEDGLRFLRRPPPPRGIESIGEPRLRERPSLLRR